jgi:hypothetical protein
MTWRHFHDRLLFLNVQDYSFLVNFLDFMFVPAVLASLVSIVLSGINSTTAFLFLGAFGSFYLAVFLLFFLVYVVILRNYRIRKEVRKNLIIVYKLWFGRLPNIREVIWELPDRPITIRFDKDRLDWSWRNSGIWTNVGRS